MFDRRILNADPVKKYQVRVTDAKTERTYVRLADRSKITQLRQNPNIKSVEMTDHGDAYEGERKKGKLTAKAKAGKGLDPVGQEDKDIDNDGDHDKTDKYLLKRRKAIGAAIRKKADKKIKEAFLADGTISTEPKPGTKKITGQGVDNYKDGTVKVMPNDPKDEDPGVKAARNGVYSNFVMNGQELSESQRKLFEMMKKKEEEDKGKLDDIATKDDIKNTAGCPPEDEEKPDTRGMYAKIAMVKNKLRSAGQKDPVVMMAMSPTKGQKLNMYGEENLQELKPAKGNGKRPHVSPMDVKGAVEDRSELEPKHNPYKKAPKGEKQATPTNMTPGKP